MCFRVCICVYSHMKDMGTCIFNENVKGAVSGTCIIGHDVTHCVCAVEAEAARAAHDGADHVLSTLNQPKIYNNNPRMNTSDPITRNMVPILLKIVGLRFSSQEIKSFCLK